MALDQITPLTRLQPEPGGVRLSKSYGQKSDSVRMESAEAVRLLSDRRRPTQACSDRSQEPSVRVTYAPCHETLWQKKRHWQGRFVDDRRIMPGGALRIHQAFRSDIGRRIY